MQFKGLDLVPVLVRVLLRFRQRRYGVSTDRLGVLKGIEQLKIIRWYFADELLLPEIKLNIICKQSKDTYTAVGYFRYKQGNRFKCSLVMSKSRVAAKRIIPCLELLAAVLSVRFRLAEVNKKEHSIIVSPTRNRWCIGSMTAFLDNLLHFGLMRLERKVNQICEVCS